MRAVMLAALLPCALATTELSKDTFDKEVFESGKAAFVKFLAPWCVRLTYKARRNQRWLPVSQRCHRCAVRPPVAYC